MNRPLNAVVLFSALAFAPVVEASPQSSDEIATDQDRQANEDLRVLQGYNGATAMQIATLVSAGEERFSAAVSRLEAANAQYLKASTTFQTATKKLRDAGGIQDAAKREQVVASIEALELTAASKEAALAELEVREDAYVRALTATYAAIHAARVARGSSESMAAALGAAKRLRAAADTLAEAEDRAASAETAESEAMLAAARLMQAATR